MDTPTPQTSTQPPASGETPEQVINVATQYLMLARNEGGSVHLIRALRDQLTLLTQTIDQDRQTIAEAMAVLAPNMPKSGLVDACRQIKQVAISEADNSEKAEQTIASLREEKIDLRRRLDEAATTLGRACVITTINPNLGERLAEEPDIEPLQSIWRLVQDRAASYAAMWAMEAQVQQLTESQTRLREALQTLLDYTVRAERAIGMPAEQSQWPRELRAAHALLVSGGGET